MTRAAKVWTLADVQGWFAGRVPTGWFTGAPTVTADRDEVVVVGPLPPPAGIDDLADDAREVAVRARIKAFREETRGARMAIADEAELLLGRKISWGVACDGVDELFTTQSVPVMTRLRLPERAVLDTLIDAGVARSRSDALGWCVRLVGTHQAEWIEQLRDAVSQVRRVRADGPDREVSGDAGTPDAEPDPDAG